MTTSRTFVLQIKLMCREAEDRLADAQTLSSTPSTRSDSAYLLSLLAFEILLKATLRIHAVASPTGHAYQSLFPQLPDAVRTRLVKTASERMTTAADFSNMDELLATWGKNFVGLRYPYEKYDELTEDEYVALGQAWLDSGAGEDQADFVYHPSELTGLTHALQVELASWLQSNAIRT